MALCDRAVGAAGPAPLDEARRLDEARQNADMASRALRELGLAILPIPHNYYEDLEARFGLDQDTLQQLEQFNILYDRDADGEYFQLISRAFAKRFFFEIVERRALCPNVHLPRGRQPRPGERRH